LLSLPPALPTFLQLFWIGAWTAEGCKPNTLKQPLPFCRACQKGLLPRGLQTTLDDGLRAEPVAAGRQWLLPCCFQLLRLHVLQGLCWNAGRTG
jgi:hypothetical protein